VSRHFAVGDLVWVVIARVYPIRSYGAFAYSNYGHSVVILLLPIELGFAHRLATYFIPSRRFEPPTFSLEELGLFLLDLHHLAVLLWRL
jgi:hypothetical protein